MRILITGGAGFIGSHTIDHLLERGRSVRVLDALIPQVHGNNGRQPSYVDHRAQLVLGRVEDPTAVSQALEGIEGVIHLASSVGVGQSMYQIVAYCTTNVIGTATLLQVITEGRSSVKSLVV